MGSSCCPDDASFTGSDLSVVEGCECKICATQFGQPPGTKRRAHKGEFPEQSTHHVSAGYKTASCRGHAETIGIVQIRRGKTRIVLCAI